MFFDEGANLGITEHDDVDLCFKDILKEVQIVVKIAFVKYHISSSQVPETAHVGNFKLIAAAVRPGRENQEEKKKDHKLRI